MKKIIGIIAACVGASLLAAGIALPSASADPTKQSKPPHPDLSACNGARRGCSGYGADFPASGSLSPSGRLC